MLVGRHGIGKSEILAEFYREQGVRVVPFFLGQMSDPGDLIGLPQMADGDTSVGRTEFVPPYWWPIDGQPIVLFLDELNRARPEILQSVMELALNKTLAGKRLPDDSRIIAAVNDGDEYQITDLDPALVSRFNVYHFSPTVDDWLRWASRHQLDDRVREFLRSQPHHLDGVGLQPNAPEQFERSALAKTPDRRGWTRVAKLIAPISVLSDIHFKLIAGIVGAAATTAFKRSLIAALPVTTDDVLLRFDSHRSAIAKLDLSELATLNEQLVRAIAGDGWDDANNDSARTNLLAHLQQIRSRKLDEAVAHFVSLITKPGHAAAMTMVTDSLELTSMLTEYMEGIRVE